MIQTQVKILTVTPQTLQVCAFIGETACVEYPGLVLSDFELKIYRTGTNLPPATPPTPPVYFLLYPAYSYNAVTGIVCFFLDSQLTGLTGQYTGDVFVSGVVSGSIEMNVGNLQGVFDPYTV